jgi:hypothetical protein
LFEGKIEGDFALDEKETYAFRENASTLTIQKIPIDPIM